MSEFPFAEPAVAADGFDDASEEGSKRTLLLAGGLAAALVVGAGGFFLLGGGGEEEVFTPIKRAPRPAAAAAAPAAPTAKIPAVFAAPVGRDPFRALYTAPVAGTAVAPAPVTPVTVIPLQPAGPVAPAPAAPVTQPTSSSGGGATASPAPAAPAPKGQSTIRFFDYDPGTKVGSFMLDGKTKVTGSVNDVLAKKVLIVAIRPDREQGSFFATLKVGDGAQFDAHYGQTVVIP